MIKPEEISSVIKDEIQRYKKELNVTEVGTVVQIGDNVARIYITKNEPEKALETLNELQKIDPNYQAARIQNMIGYLCWQLGRFDEVVVRCKKALEVDPKDISALENLGTVYMKKGMYKDAAIEFQKVLEIEPNNPKAMRMLQAMSTRK